MMIKTYDCTPQYYNHQSRDFQLLGHLYDACFNNSKVGIDTMTKMVVGNNMTEQLAPLGAYTVGFENRHEYNKKDLLAIISSFAYLIRRKGTLNAIKYALNILMRSQGLSDPYEINVNSKEKRIDIYLSKRLDDVMIIKDLFEYLLPVGMTYRIYNYKTTDENKTKMKLTTKDSVKITTVDKNNSAIVGSVTKTIIDNVSDISNVEQRAASVVKVKLLEQDGIKE
jgi:hypothetical protein